MMKVYIAKPLLDELIKILSENIERQETEITKHSNSEIIFFWKRKHRISESDWGRWINDPENSKIVNTYKLK